jgi:hypothetical protein
MANCGEDPQKQTWNYTDIGMIRNPALAKTLSDDGTSLKHSSTGTENRSWLWEHAIGAVSDLTYDYSSAQKYYFVKK